MRRQQKRPSLSRTVGWGHILSIVLVYGLSQGVGETVGFRGRDYYFKNDMGLSPADSQFYKTIAHIPWDVKPLLGFFSDTVPILGYHLKPHMMLAGVIGVVSFALLALLPTQTPAATTILLMLNNLSMASPDVAIDAANSQLTTISPWISSDLQSLTWACFAVGALLGAGTSGVIAEAGGASAMFATCVLTSTAVIVAGLVLVEPRGAAHGLPVKAQVRLLFKTLAHPIVFRLATFIFISHSMLHIDQAMFFWYQDKEAGPGFSKKFIGLMDLFSYVGMLIGVLVYNRFCTAVPFFRMFGIAQVLVALGSLVDLPFVLRWNTKIGIPDEAFAVTDYTLFSVVRRLQYLPFYVIVAKVCPDEIAGTMFACLMSLSNFASDVGEYTGAGVIKWLQITSTDFSNLWLAIVVRSAARLFPLLFLWLIPRNLDPSCEIHTVHLPTDSGNGDESTSHKRSAEMHSMATTPTSRALLQPSDAATGESGNDASGSVGGGGKYVDFDIDDDLDDSTTMLKGNRSRVVFDSL